MYFVFLLLWIVFNGRVTPEILLMGAALSALMYLFLWRFMGYSPRTDLRILRNFFWGLWYVLLLVWEVLKANVMVIKLVLSPRILMEPVLVSFETDLRSDLARVVLANSITLTPGTITCNLGDDGRFVVHCLDESMAEGIDDSSFVRLLRRMEGTK